MQAMSYGAPMVNQIRCTMHQQDFVCFCYTCNQYKCEICRQQCRADHQQANSQILFGSILREAEQFAGQLNEEMLKRQKLLDEINSMVCDIQGISMQMQQDVVIYEQKVHAALLQKQNEAIANAHMAIQNRTALYQGLSKEISDITAWKNAIDALYSRTRSYNNNLHFAIVKECKDELERFKQTKYSINSNLCNSASNIKNQFQKVVSGEWKADALMSVYCQDSSIQSKLGQIRLSLVELSSKMQEYESKKKELDYMKDQEERMIDQLTATSSVLKNWSSSLEQISGKPGFHPIKFSESIQPANKYPVPIHSNIPMTFAPTAPPINPASPSIVKIPCCSRNVDPMTYLSDLEKHNRVLLVEEKKDITREELHCPKCDRVIRKSDLVDSGFPVTALEKVMNNFPSKREAVSCVHCGKPIRSDEKIIPCDDPYHKTCLLEYVEKMTNKNYQCKKCTKSIFNGYEQLLKEKESSEKTCCVCMAGNSREFQVLSCGHFFCINCYKKNQNSQMIFASLDKEFKVKCNHCHSYTILLKIKLDCGCTHDYQSLKLKLNVEANGNYNSALCPSCRKPVYGEDAKLIFGPEKINHKTNPLNLGQSQFNRGQTFLTPSKEEKQIKQTKVQYVMGKCHVCCLVTEGIQKYQCSHEFFCRGCIKK